LRPATLINLALGGADSATRAERLITLLPPEDIAALPKSVSSLSRAIEEFPVHRSEAPLGSLAYRSFGGEEERLFPQAGIDMLNELKRQGVHDPDIDFLLAADEKNADQVQTALAAGAHPYITINKVLTRHADKFQMLRTDQDQQDSSGTEGQRGSDASGPASGEE
jgi:hypothetical protein